MSEKPELIDEWLARSPEEPMEAELEIVDCHHHLWDPAIHPKGPMNELYAARNHFVPRVLCCRSRRAHKSLLRRYVCGSPEGQGFYNHLGGMEGRGPSSLWRYMMEELRRDIGKNNVTQTVYVECGWEPAWVPPALQPVGEVEMVVGCAAADPRGRPNGIIAKVDFRLGPEEAERTLLEHKRYKSVRGIRQALAFCHVSGVTTNGADGYLMSEQEPWRRAFALLEKHDLLFESWHYHINLSAFTELARTFPRITMVNNHVGTPLGIGPWAPPSSQFSKWKAAITELAKLPNVYCKLSGLGMGACGFDFEKRDTPASSDELAKAWGPYYTHCVEQFGFERCMFCSNFPVDKMSGSYTAHWNAFKKICNAAGYTAEQKRMLLATNARKLYRLPEPE